ncbi:NUAK SNF1-like kinase 1 [Mortierella polycephala]|uniref:NUAK SNF1-like kinase 1 n=1 Tax=Mortierella polycephala TaxID=41804 RepID=A0A9P6U7C8_9FUNG|nr:NUAK SNF1-like kinase 1 [Mortierella polycephala]
MNTAALNTSHPHPKQDAAYVRPDSYTVERLAAQEAMKSMRIADTQQSNHRRKASEINEVHAASRVERYLASRAHSMRESSKNYENRMAEKEPPLKMVPHHVDTEQKWVTVESKESTIPDADSSKPLDLHTDSKTGTDNNEHNLQYHQPQKCAQGADTNDPGSHTAPTQQFHNVKAPIPSSPSTNNEAGPATAPQPSSGQQSRLSHSGSSKESYRRKYGEIQGYTYIGTIGQGNFGKVLLAENDITGEQVAVKILEKAQFKSEQQRLHATREARLMATLRHPNIVDVKTVMEDDYRILIVMENLTGGELFDYISNKGSLDEKEARRIFQQIVLAIHYCHESKVVHRDLKPENILLDSERNVRVADFGFGNNWHKDRHLTTYCGSPFYAAPEMVSGTPYIGPETDVWSLGVILYVLVCGRLPFDASDLPALFAQIKRGNYQKPREGSIDVCSLIHRMLTVDPKRRATLTDVLRSRWMRTDGMDSMATALPALSTTPTAIRPSAARTHQQQRQQQPQAQSTALSTFHPNSDISTTMQPTVNTTHSHRHSYHPPGSSEISPQETHAPSHAYQQPPQQQQYPSSQSPTQELDDDQMSDVSPSMANSPTETMATISPSTPVAPNPRDDALSAAVAGAPLFQKRSNAITCNSYDDKHHPYKHHARTSSAHSHHHNSNHNQPSENVIINMCPSTDALMDGLDSSLKKKRRTLTKLRQFFRFETSKC